MASSRTRKKNFIERVWDSCRKICQNCCGRDRQSSSTSKVQSGNSDHKSDGGLGVGSTKRNNKPIDQDIGKPDKKGKHVEFKLPEVIESSDEQEGPPSSNEKPKDVKPGNFNGDDKCTDPSPLKTVNIKAGEAIISGENIWENNKAAQKYIGYDKNGENNKDVPSISCDERILKDEYRDTCPPKETRRGFEEGFEEKVVKQSRFNEEDKYADISRPEATKRSFPEITKSSFTGTFVDKNLSYSKEGEYTDTSSSKKTEKNPVSSNEDKYADISPPEIGKRVEQIVIQQTTSYSRTTKSRIAEKVVRQVSFNKDDKYADVSLPKTTKSS